MNLCLARVCPPVFLASVLPLALASVCLAQPCAFSVSPQVTYSGFAAASPSIVLADVNADGFPDMVEATSAASVLNLSTIAVRLNNGLGAFGPVISTPIGVVNGSFRFGLAVADMNDDGVRDVVVTDAVNNGVLIFRGLNNGSFQTPPSAHATGPTPARVVVGDFNNDAIPDIATSSTNQVSVLLGLGNGFFQTRLDAPLGPVGVDQGGFFMAAADIDNDGRLDLAVVCTQTSTVAVLRGSGNGSFQPALSIATPGSTRSIAIGDLNTDGRKDIMITQNSYTMRLIPGLGNGTFGPIITIECLNDTTQARGLALADVNNDGKLDIITTNYIGLTTGSIGVHISTGAGGFLAQTLYGSFPLASNFQYENVAAADVNGDGLIDFASTTTSPTTIMFTNFTGGSANITQAPTSQKVAAGSPAIFTVATAVTNASYQWFRNGVLLLNSANVTGATTAALTVLAAQAANEGVYEVRVSTPCSTVRASAFLSIVAPCNNTNPCPADFNADGEVNPDDLADYIGAYFSGAPCN